MSSPKQLRVAFEETDVENSPPWPEWSDSYINNIQWSRPPVKRSLSSTKMRGPPVTEVEDLYEDPAGLPELPLDVPVYCWKRPHHINPGIKYVVESEPTPLDLLTHNKHLLNYEIMRVIISNIACLERESFNRPFPIEFQSEHFTANGGIEWKPWHHVYALTLAGKGQIHKPMYNPFGKYIVRLFFLGKWRRVVVDDQLPLDDGGQVLLPMSRPDNLWLPLLSKALLRVACLSWQPPRHCVDLSIIHNLTGWIQTTVPCKGCSVYHLWCVCCQLMPTTEEVVAAAGCCKSDLNMPSSTADTTGLSAVSSRALMAVIAQPFGPGDKKDSVTTTGASERLVLISNVRYNSEQPTPLWKQYRWYEWAFNKGIISEIPHNPVRNIQIYNPLDPHTEAHHDMHSLFKDEVWLNFDIFLPHVRSLEVFYKPSYFKYSMRAWSEKELFSPIQTAEDVIKSVKKSLPSEIGGGDAKSTKKSKSTKSENPGKSIAPSSNEASSKGTPKNKRQKDKGELSKDEREEWPINRRKHSFFYFIIDSMSNKEVLVSLNVYSPQQLPYAIFFIGIFEWHSPSVAPIIERMSTTATTARFFILTPGLRVYRIWYQFPSYFCLQMFSNSYFQIGSKMFIQQSLTMDSISYKFYGKEISSCFEQLLGVAKGGAEHGKMFQQLMDCLGPPQLTSQLPWPCWFKAYTELLQAFEESVTEMLVECTHNAEETHQILQAFKMLFLNPVFGEKKLSIIRPEYYDYIIQQNELQKQKQLLLEEKLTEQLPQVIEQKGKKGPKSDKSKKKSTGSSKTEVESTIPKTAKTKEKEDKKGDTKPTSQGEPMRKLLHCKEKNLVINDPNQAILIIKKMISKVPHLRYLYPFDIEDDRKPVYKDYIGEVEVSDKWVVLVRCILNIHSTEEVPCSLHAWSPVENLVLSLINNDTNEEVLPLGFIENNVAYLTRNTAGYTVYVYGISDDNTVVPWRLRSVGLRDIDCLHVCSGDSCTNTHNPLPGQSQQTVNGYYLPNKQNIIASCILEVYSDVTVLVRLKLSHKRAQFRFTVIDEEGNLVTERIGLGYIIVTSLKLKGKKRDSSELNQENPLGDNSSVNGSGELQPSIYKIEVKLVGNSWPLKYSQMRTMLYYKENLPEILLGQTEMTPGSSRKQNQGYTIFESTEKPCWSITLVSDLQKEMSVKLCEDTSLYEMMNELKAQWQQEGVDLNHCRSLRQGFLRQLSEQDEEEFCEETVFKLEPRKLNKLNNLYGVKPSSDHLQGDISVSERAASSVHTEITTSTFVSTLFSQLPVDNSSQHESTFITESGQTSQLSSHSSTMNVSSTSLEAVQKVDHSNVMVQQAGIHKALENMRNKTMDHIQQIFKETADLREKMLSEMKMAKEAETKVAKSESKKEKKSKDLSPTDTKRKKSPSKESKKPKSSKGKGK